MLLKNRVSDLEELLSSAHEEKEDSVQQLVSHMNTITELTEQHSRASELQSATEARISETEAKMHEAIQNLTQKESEGKELMDKLHSFEALVKTYEEQTHETATLAENQKMELEQSHKNLRHLESVVEELKGKYTELEKEKEGLTQENIKLKGEMSSNDSKLNDLEAKVSAAFAEKNEAVEELKSSNKVIDNLKEQLTSEGQKLQLQVSAWLLFEMVSFILLGNYFRCMYLHLITHYSKNIYCLQLSSILEENNLLNETHQTSKKEHQNVIAHLEEQLKAIKSSEASLKSQLEVFQAEIHQKSQLESRIKELEDHLGSAEAQVKEEVM